MVEFPYVFHSASHDTIILCGHGTFIKANPIMLLTSVQSLFKFYQFFTNVFFSVQDLSRVARCISLSYLLSFIQSVDYSLFQDLSRVAHCISLSYLLSFIQSVDYSLFQDLSRVAHCISLSYLLSFILSVDYFQSLSFMTLTFWKNTDQLFCRVSFHLDLSNIF